RVLLLPALADIGAGRLLADRMQLVLADERARLVIFARDRRLDADPRRLARDRIVRLVGLLGMAWLRIGHRDINGGEANVGSNTPPRGGEDRNPTPLPRGERVGRGGGAVARNLADEREAAPPPHPPIAARWAPPSPRWGEVIRAAPRNVV